MYDVTIKSPNKYLQIFHKIKSTNRNLQISQQYNSANRNLQISKAKTLLTRGHNWPFRCSDLLGDLKLISMYDAPIRLIFQMCVNFISLHLCSLCISVGAKYSHLQAMCARSRQTFSHLLTGHKARRQAGASAVKDQYLKRRFLSRGTRRLFYKTNCPGFRGQFSQFSFGRTKIKMGGHKSR